MFEELCKFITRLKSFTQIQTYDEAATKQAIILPTLQMLGWITQDINEVYPEYSVEGKRVDYSLRLNNSNEVFIEVKKVNEELENHQEQLLEYSFRQGVELATLTNGITWLFYLPTKKGDWAARKFYAIDILEQETHDAAKKFIDILSKQNVQSGEAIRKAEAIYRGRMKKLAISDTLPEAWRKIITEPDSLLIDLIAEVTEKLCGFKPSAEEAIHFLKSNQSQFITKSSVVITNTQRPRGKHQKKSQLVQTGIIQKVSREDLIQSIVEVLRKNGGSLSKIEVEKIIHSKYKNLFKQQYYQELVSNGIPRWKHNIAWAKEDAKNKGLIKPPKESGRGYWELK